MSRFDSQNSLVELILAGAIIVLSAFEYASIDFVPITMTTFVIGVLATISAGFSGQWPIPSTLVTLGLIAGWGMIDHIIWTTFASYSAMICFQALTRYKMYLQAIIAVVVFSLLSLLTIWQNLTTKAETLIFTLILTLLSSGIAMLIGHLRAGTRQRLEQLQTRQETKLEHMRQAIARDLHDTIAQSLAVMIMRAETATYRNDVSPETVKDLRFMITTGEECIQDLRNMLETLRKTGDGFEADAQSPWVLSSLEDTLKSEVGKLRETGYMPRITIRGDLNKLGHSATGAIGKTIVETCTNMKKHGTPESPCSLHLSIDENGAHYTVTNGVKKSGNTPQHLKGGLGLIGISERLESIGGKFASNLVNETYTASIHIPADKCFGR